MACTSASVKSDPTCTTHKYAVMHATNLLFPWIARTPHNPTATTGLEADGSTGDVKAADEDRSKGNAAAERQTEGPSKGQTGGAADRQPEGALQSALSRLGGMLESGGPSMHHMCSQFEAPAGHFCCPVSHSWSLQSAGPADAQSFIMS